MLVQGRWAHEQYLLSFAAGKMQQVINVTYNQIDA